MFRVLSTPIVRSTLTVSTASGTGHTSVQLPSSNVAEFKLSTPIIRSILTVSTASGTGHTSVQLPSSNVADFNVSGAFHTHHQEYNNCIYSLRYRSYIGAATFLQRG